MIIDLRNICDTILLFVSNSNFNDRNEIDLSQLLNRLTNIVAKGFTLEERNENQMNNDHSIVFK